MRYSFARFILDTESHKLQLNGADIAVEPQVFDLLHLLVANAGKLVTKDQMMEDVWQGRIVSEATVSARINAARKAVGDNGKDQAIIRTVARRGLEMAVPVEIAGEATKVKQRETSKQTIKYTTSKDGAAIAFATSGSGPPLLRAGHNLTHLELDWASEIWPPLFNALGENHTLIRFDIRGTGLSDSDLDGKNIQHYVDDMAAVADASGLGQFPILTSLQNTPVALHYIAQNPERVSKLIIQNGYCNGRALRGAGDGTPENDPVISLASSGWGQVSNGFMRAWMSLINPNATYEESSELIELLAAACPVEKFIQNRMINDRFTAAGVLDQINIPTLIVHSRNDAIHPLAEAQILARGIKNAEFLVVASGNTICMPSDPTWQQQVDAIQEFLAR
jgi:DNA-binding winged helix-turn-helix (wHTH) protein/fermentation-respiration switch protein FrsA (DUF1100 family)